MNQMDTNSNSNNKNNNYVRDDSQASEDSSTVDCRICNEQFDDMAKMQIHVMVKHMNEGDIPED